jgi:hypothetical protein
MLTRRGLLAASGALLGALSGCSINSLNLALIGFGPREEAFLPGPLDVTFETTDRAMKALALDLRTTREHDRVTFTGQTRAGNRFTVTLRRNPLEKGENTRINVVWEKEADSQFWLDLLEVTGSIHLPGNIG